MATRNSLQQNLYLHFYSRLQTHLHGVVKINIPLLIKSHTLPWLLSGDSPNKVDTCNFTADYNIFKHLYVLIKIWQLMHEFRWWKYRYSEGIQVFPRCTCHLNIKPKNNCLVVLHNFFWVGTGRFCFVLFCFFGLFFCFFDLFFKSKPKLHWIIASYPPNKDSNRFILPIYFFI